MTRYLNVGRHLQVTLAVLGSLVVLLSATMGGARAADWPQFRGPTGQGIAGDAQPPLTWSESRNVAWKVAVPGKGWSSPVVAGNQIWLTSATDDGRSLRAVALDFDSGRILQDVEVFHNDIIRPIQQKNSHASPTPILEGDRIYVHFGALGTAALNTAGEIIWKNTELQYQHGHGSGGSPALSGDLLIISCDGTDRQYVVALDKNTGKIRWRTERQGTAMAYTTPLVIEVEGRKQVVSPSGFRAFSYDTETGKELWSLSYGQTFSNVARPVFGHGLVYVTSAYHSPVLYAIRPDGHGDITQSHVAWSYQRGVPLTPSPLLVGDQIYVVSDNGIATCLNAETGQELWRGRLEGQFSASPVLAGGRIYFQNEMGGTTVIQPGTSFRKLAENQIDGSTLASMAVVGRAILLRSDTHLYRIEEH